MTFEQFTKRFNEMFPDRSLWDETKELGFDQIQCIDGRSEDEIIEKMTFCFVMSICQKFRECGAEIVDDLTDALMVTREQILNGPVNKSYAISTSPDLFIKDQNAEPSEVAPEK